MPVPSLLSRAVAAAIITVLGLGISVTTATPALAETAQAIGGTVYLGDTSRPAAAGDAAVYLQPSYPAAPVEIGPIAVGDGGLWRSVAEPGTYDLRVVYLGTGTYGPPINQGFATAGRTDAVSVLRLSFTVNGTVRLGGATTAPPGSVRVVLSSPLGTQQSTTVTADGRWSFTDLYLGTYTLRAEWIAASDAWKTVEWPGDGCSTLSKCLVVDRNRTIDMTMPHAGLITGLVTTAGRPAAGVAVYLDRPDAAPGAPTEVLSTTTGSDGRYELRFVPDGSYVVSFASPDPAIATAVWSGGDPYLGATELTVSAGGTVTNIDQNLVLASSIAANVTNVPAADLAEGDVTADLWILDGTEWVDTGDSWLVEPDGSFLIEDLYPGSYKVIVNYHGPLGRSSQTQIIPIAQSGTTRRAEIRLALPAVPNDQARFITQLYADFLGRRATSGDVLNWGDALARGFPRGSVAGGFVNSDEYRLIRIDAAYQSILRRPAEAGGRLSWLNGMKKGTLSTDDIERALFSSDEYYNSQGGTNFAYVQSLYRNILNRDATFEEAGGWSARLSSGFPSSPRLTRPQLVDIFWISLETGQQRARTMFRLYLRREASQSDYTAFGGYILQYGDSAVRSMITGSQEYFDYAQRSQR